MERISDKDLNNVMRPGSIFISSRDDNLRFVDQDGAENWSIATSRYYASEEILRGQAVAIAQLDALDEKLADDKYAYIKIIDPDLDEHCLGVAMNYAKPGDIVHVQSSGKFSYYTTESSYYKDATKGRKDKEVFLDASENGSWNISKVRGQAVYVKKVVEYPDAWETGHNTEDVTGSTDIYNNFTYDIDDSIYNAKNTIQLGYLVDAPTVEADDEDQIVTLELNVTGDTRGPIDNTSFLMKLGEDVYFDYDTKTGTEITQEDLNKDGSLKDSSLWKNEYNGPDCNKGIFDEIKVVSLSGEPAHKASFTLFTRTEVNKDSFTEGGAPKNAFIAVRKLDGPTIFTPVFGELDFGGLTNANDKGYVSLTRAFAGSIKNEYATLEDVDIPEDSYNYDIFDETDPESGKFVFIQKDPLQEITTKSVTGAIKQSLDVLTKLSLKTTEKLTANRNYISMAPEKEQNKLQTKLEDWVPSEDIDIGENGRKVTAGVVDGYYDIYISKELLPYIAIKQRKHGSAAPKGSAILADVRDGNRLNVVGVIVSNQKGWHQKGSTIRVMKMGRMTTKGEIIIGKQFYVGLNGRITTRNQYWYDYNVPIGIAESNHYFIVDCHLPQKDYDGAFPLGFVKPSTYGMASKGFLLMDGYTIYNKRDWPELYEALKQWYGEDQLKPSNRTLEAVPLLQELRKNYFNSIQEPLDLLNEERLDAIQDDVTEVKDDLQNHLEDFENYKDSNSDLEKKINEGFEKVDEKFKENENAYKEKVGSLEKEINNSNEIATKTHAFVHDVIEPNVKNLQEDIDKNIKPDVKDLQDKATTLQNDVDNKIKPTVTDLQTGQSTLQTNQGAIKKDVGNNADAITALQDEINTLKTNIKALQDKLDSLNSTEDTSSGT